MRFDRWKLLAASAGALGLSLASGFASAADEPVLADVLFVVAEAGQEEQPPAPREDVIIQLREPLGDGSLQVQPLAAFTRQIGGAPQSKYWIGVMCSPADESLRAQLNLTEPTGVVVVDLVPESPAAKSGLQKFDLILTAGDAKIDNGEALMEVVEKSGTQQLQLHVIRRGQPTTIDVTPAERQAAGPPVQPLAPAAPQDAWRLLERFRGEGDGPVMRFFHPGVVLPPGPEQKMPDNLNVRIEKHGNEPTKIHVEQDGKSWDVTEDKLGELPEETRGHVSRLLGRGPMLFGFHGPNGEKEGEFNMFQRAPEGEFNIQVAPPPPGAPQVRPLPPGGPSPEWSGRVRSWVQRAEELGGDRLEKRLDQLDERLDRLQSLIEGLQQKQPTGTDAPPKP